MTQNSNNNGKEYTKQKSSKTKEEVKKFLEYNQSKPFQLSRFDLFDNEKEFSHTIELYDFIPKFVWGKVENLEEAEVRIKTFS